MVQGRFWWELTFDDAKINTDSLVKATTNAGFPSQPEKSVK
jgi:hypothetical protein